MQDLARKRVLVTGGAGFLGAWVVRRLRELAVPDGQLRRCRDTSRAEREFGFRARPPFPEGLERTVRWYLAERQARR